MSSPQLFLQKVDFLCFVVHDWHNHFKSFGAVKRYVETQFSLKFVRDYLNNGQLLSQSEEGISLLVNKFWFRIDFEGKGLYDRNAFARAHTIGIELRKNFFCRVSRCDLAFDFIDVTPSKLLNAKDLKFKYKKIETRGADGETESLYFKNIKHVITVYNKTLELKRSSHPRSLEILRLYPDVNITRLEIRLKGRSVLKNAESYFFNEAPLEDDFIQNTLHDYSKNKICGGIIKELAKKGKLLPIVKDEPRLKKLKIRGFKDQIEFDPEVSRFLKAAVNRALKNGWTEEKVFELLSGLWARASSPTPEKAA